MVKENENWLRRLADIECPDSTFIDFSSSIVFDKAQGSYVYDVEGKSYLDLCAGFGALAFGHNPPFLKKVMTRYAQDEVPQVFHGMGDVYPAKSKIEFLETIRGHLPSSLSMGALCLSGAGAVEFAMKTAILASGKNGFIAFRGGYHGLDFGALSLTERHFFKNRFQTWLPEKHVRLCAYDSSLDQLKDDLRTCLQEQKRLDIGTAAVVVEPVQGRGGVRVPRADWLGTLTEFCKNEGVLLIFDEIFTGVGRSGTFCHVDLDQGVDCDLICLGKALGGGMPLSACFGKPQVMRAWPKNSGEAMHTGTFFGHPFSCEVGKACLEAMTAEKIFLRVQENGLWFSDELKKLAQKNTQIKEVRGKGLMVGVEFRSKHQAEKLMPALLQKGVIALPAGSFGQVLSFTPPLNIERKDLEKSLSVIEQVLSEN